MGNLGEAEAAWTGSNHEFTVDAVVQAHMERFRTVRQIDT
jgi:hypothetical protein